MLDLTIYGTFNINFFHMQVILNYFVFFLIYLSLQIFLYRFIKININKLPIILFIIATSVVVGFYSHSTELLINLININLMIICFWILIAGNNNSGPALTIIEFIVNKKINEKKKLKKFFL